MFVFGYFTRLLYLVAKYRVEDYNRIHAHKRGNYVTYGPVHLHFLILEKIRLTVIILFSDG